MLNIRILCIRIECISKKEKKKNNYFEIKLIFHIGLIFDILVKNVLSTDLTSIS